MYMVYKFKNPQIMYSCEFHIAIQRIPTLYSVLINTLV